MEHQVVIYFDNNATAPLTHFVKEGLVETLSAGFANPSSDHIPGWRARRAVAAARSAVACLIGGDPGRILFTSGATEANNLALRNGLQSSRAARAVTVSVEHASVLQPFRQFECEGKEVSYLNVGPAGEIDLDGLQAILTSGPAFVSIQWANNETGIEQPIHEVAKLCRTFGATLHVDAAQALGRIPIDLGKLDVDYLTLSGHKMHAPAGIGALYCKSLEGIVPMLWGGDQEQGVRPGTENLLGIVGFGLAAEERAAGFDADVGHMDNLRMLFEAGLEALPVATRVIGRNSNRVPNTTNVQFVGVDGQALVARLTQQGLMCSQSSACHSARPEPSYVLRAMGLSESEAYSCVRFSFSVLNTADEVSAALELIAANVGHLKQFAMG